MTSFRSLARDMREQRRALTRNTSYGGKGHLFCERHRRRYPETQRCPVCMPGAVAVRRR